MAKVWPYPVAVLILKLVSTWRIMAFALCLLATAERTKKKFIHIAESGASARIQNGAEGPTLIRAPT